MKHILVALLAAALLQGCVVNQSKSGEVSFGFIDPGTTVAEFDSANGKTRLRRHLDGSYGLRFSDRLTQYNMGSFDDVRVVARHDAGGRTGVLFERRRKGCMDYELVTIAPNQVGRNSVGAGCNVPVEAAVIDNVLVVREAVNERARFWLWSANGISTGREQAAPPPPRAPARTATTRQQPKGKPSPQSTTSKPAATPKATASTARRPATSASPASRAPTSTASRITLPSGSIQTTPVEPVRVVLQKGGRG